MKLIYGWVKNSKNWFKSVKDYVNKGLLSAVKEMNRGTTGVDNTEAPPSKKLCVDEKNEILQKGKKVKQKKVALLVGYSGDDYCGLQVNTSVKTIEGELLSALCKAEMISPESVSEPHTIRFQRTARTDKGVSAAKQVISLKIAENYCVESINKYLPQDIKVFSAKRVTKGFNCKNDCTARTYSYTLPTFALAPELHTEYPEKYRITQEVMQKASEILHSYKGTHNFHNFTVKKNPLDPSVKRYMMSVTAEEPFLEGDEEFITLKIKGQSFMFHQIRKMVGHWIAVLKGITPKEIQTDVWSQKKYSVPLAPGLGLMLEDVHFDRYDRRYGKDGIHETLCWSELADEINSFRSFILSSIIKKEIERKSMFNWTKFLSVHSYNYDENFHHLKTSEEIEVENLPDEKTDISRCA